VKKAELGAIGDRITNGASNHIEHEIPYIAEVKIKGTSDMLFHAWNCEAVAEKSAAKKGSAVKKSDNMESYIYRNDKGEICIPGSYLKGCIVGSAKFRQDPRSPRKSAQDLFKAGIVPITDLASLGVKQWDYDHKCRVVIQRNAITRVRPAFRAGWEATFQLMVNIPEYISQDLLLDVIVASGKLIGLADFRPTYGRFSVVGFELVDI